MPDYQEAALRHYEAGLSGSDPAARIVDALVESGIRLDATSLEALDQFHAGGVAATLKLAEILAAPPGSSVLDAGSGLGGPARMIAERFGYHVTGVDLVPSYVDLARCLAEKVGLGESVSFEVGDLLALPFGTASFDGAYTQHVAMNIPDRDALYAEVRRVLKRGAGFAFHDVIASDGADRPVYPTPWAKSARSSFLLDEDETVAALQRADLRVDAWEDVSNDAASAIAKLRLGASRGPTLEAIMGERFANMAQNYGRNLREGRLRVVMGRATAY